MFNYLLVFLGGGLGASLRHSVNIACAKCIGTAFPYGTFIINISGAFSLDTALLYERGAIGLAAFYVLGSVGFSIAGLFAGLALIRYLT